MSKKDKLYIATLNDLKKWFDEEGLSHDKPIRFYTQPMGPALHVASTYPDEKGRICVDLEGK